MKFGQSTEYKMKNIFLEKLYTRCGREASPRPLIKINIRHISGSTVGNVIKFVFIYIQVEIYQNILHVRHVRLVKLEKNLYVEWLLKKNPKKFLYKYFYF